MQTRARDVLVIAFDEVELLDVAATLSVLSTAGRRWNFRPFKVRVAAPRAGLVETRNQTRFEARVALADATPAEIVIVPGGYGARRLLSDAAFTAQLARVGQGAEILAGIGWGAALLAAAGLLDDARVAARARVAETLAELRPRELLDENAPTLSNGRVITAANSGNSLDLALAIVNRTLGAKMTASVADELGMTTPRIELKY